MARPPAELALDLRGVERVAPVVAGPIGHERDQRPRIGTDQVTQRTDDLEVRRLVPAGDVMTTRELSQAGLKADDLVTITRVNTTAETASIDNSSRGFY